jgi:hypothetical protein
MEKMVSRGQLYAPRYENNNVYHELLFPNEWTEEHVERMQPDCADNAKRPRAI